MYTNDSHRADATSDLAARLTDVGLELLAGVSTASDSVETELRLWHTLRAELSSAPQRRPFLGTHGAGALMRVVHRAAQRVADGGHAFVEAHSRHSERADACMC